MPTDPAQVFLAQGNALFRADKFEEAAENFRRALEIAPTSAPASFNLGCALDRSAGPTQSLPHFAKAVSLRPDWCEARSNFGFALARVGRMHEAALEFEAAAALSPTDASIRNDLGLALSALGRGEEAFASFQTAIALNPLAPEPHNNLAVLLEKFGRTSEAISACLKALRLRPDYPEAHNNLAVALKSQGRHAEALQHYREALRLKPDDPEARSSLLFTLCYPAAINEEEVAAEHFSFGAAHSFRVLPHPNERTPERRLRIGYVSADFRCHAVARFIEPVLRHHDRRFFRVFCYSNVTVPDPGSTRIAQLCDSFINILGVPDATAAEMIRRDGIDILVDLSGHTAGNRLPLFARKPAPIQVTWLGYPHTTGLAAIDYRITDAVCDPPGLTEPLHREKLLRLPGNFSCFAPDEDAPDVGPLPCLVSGVLTFGSFNNPAKITRETVALWAAALHGVPGSRMLVKGYSLADRGSQERLLSLFDEQGIGSDRLDLLGNTRSYRDHLELYRRVDVALDTFPYNGTTTTCEALWMGVPVVTLSGATHRSRVGASLLAALDLQDLVARDQQNFARAAIGLARNQARLGVLRKSLRSTMAGSRLTDGARFTTELEAAYRHIWHAWCASQAPADTEAPHPHPAPPLAGEPVPPLSRGRERVASESASRHTVSGRAGSGATTSPLPSGGEQDGVALGTAFLRRDVLDQALSAFLSGLGAESSRSAALAGVQQTLNRQIAVELSDALDRDAVRLGAKPLALEVERLREGTVEAAAAALVALGLPTPAELICRYLQDGGRQSASLSRTLGDAALGIGCPGAAAEHFRAAIAAGDRSVGAKISLVKATQSASLTPGPSQRQRFLVIKAWGYGFWSDVSHVLGQLLVAEITGRTPVIHWGGNSLFSDDATVNAFESFFAPVSPFTLSDVARSGRSFFPPKWNPDNLAEVVNQSDGPWSRISSLHALQRPEDVVVSDFHYLVNDLVPWIPAGHHLHGMTTEQVSRYLFRRYLRVRPELQARADDFYDGAMAGRVHLALHIRGGDKGGEDSNLARLNALYPLEIDLFLQRNPQGRLFLMTDDDNILSGYLRRYGDKVVHTDAIRTSSGLGVHYQKQQSRSRLAEQVIIDALLAIRCDYFVGNGLSNVSCAVAQMKDWAPGTMKLLGARLDRLRHLTMYRS